MPRRAPLLPLALLLVAACSSKPTLTIGQVMEGSLDSTDRVSLEGPWEDTWTFDGDEGQRVRIEMRSGDLDALLRLRGPGGDLLGSNDDALGRDAAMTLRLPAGGRYTILATSYGTGKARGAYRVAVNLVPGTFADPGAPGTLAVGQATDGVLEVGDSTRETGGFVDYYAFSAEADTVVQFDLISTQFDTYLSLQDSLGVTVATDDDGGDANNARLRFAVARGARYRIAATSYGGARSGVYRLAVQAGGPLK